MKIEEYLNKKNAKNYRKITLERIITLHSAIGFLDTVEANEKGIVVVLNRDETVNVEYSDLLNELANINTRKKEIINSFLNSNNKKN